MKTLLGAAAFLLCSAVSAAPQERFVYTYTFVRNTTNEVEHAYGLNKMDPGGGFTQLLPNINQHHLPPLGGGYDPPDRRAGTLTVDVTGRQPDGGTILRIGDSANGAAEAVTCVAYADTTLVCDPNAKVAPEIPFLASLLGRDFLDATRLDAAKHWQTEAQGTYAMTSDFRILHADGSTIEIEQSGLRAANGTAPETELSAKIGYDSARSLPASVDASSVSRTQRGTIYQTIVTHAVFQLVP